MDWFKLPYIDRATTRNFRVALILSSFCWFKLSATSSYILQPWRVGQRHPQRHASAIATNHRELEPWAPRSFKVTSGSIRIYASYGYINVPIRVGAGNIKRTLSKQPPHHLIGTIKPGANISASMTSKLYVGSMINSRWGYLRIKQHEAMINKSCIPDIHYDFARQGDVCSNFGVLGI